MNRYRIRVLAWFKACMAVCLMLAVLPAVPGKALAASTAIAWTFDADGNTEGWSAQSGITGFGASGGVLNGTVTQKNAFMTSGDNLGIDITNNKVIRIRMKNNTGTNMARIYFTTNAEGTFEGSKLRDFSLIRNDSGYTDYYIDMSPNAKWTGTLKQLRIDPIVDSPSGAFSIDEIRIGTGDAPITYYVSSSGGSDGNSGTSPSAPWRTLAKVSSRVFKPGDQVLLKRGDAWNEALYMHGAGTAVSPIKVGAYATGARPMIKRNDVKEDRALWWEHEMYAQVQSLTVRNAGMGIILWNEGTNAIDDCIAINIKGLYGTYQSDVGYALWSVGMASPGSITNSEGWGAQMVGANIDRAYIHDVSDPGTSYAGLSNQGYWPGAVFSRILLDNAAGSATYGTSSIILSHARGLTLDHVIVKNTPHAGNPDEGGIDFEDDNQNVTITDSVFVNNAGPAIEILRGGATLTASSGIEIKNAKFIRNNWAHTNTDPSEIQIYDWTSPNKPTNVTIHDNEYTLASGVKFFGGEGDKTGTTLWNNTATANIAYNHEPDAYAGEDKSVSGSAVSFSDAHASDDGGVLTVLWEQLSGPGVATFDDAHAVNTTAHLPASGAYEFRLVADDGTYFKTSYVTVTSGSALAGRYKIVNQLYPDLVLQNAGGTYNGIAGTENVADTPIGWNLPEQIWSIVDAGGGYYRIVNELHPYVALQDVGGVFNNVTGSHNVALAPTSWNLPEQLWRITNDGSGHYTIVNKLNPSVELQDAGGTFNNIPGTHIVALTPTSWNLPEQKWSLVRPGS
ncbi:RICIN domain-containing protein [Cohnella nanjingensis]|uniref:RICIN domain-containing protein n=1 Tax=Cohnella nanjingensis TaxID=1387779 RepID=A0A7X0VEZ8_9BACL|nr:RICIN domain-containing protein [Cohnella nanjingensis]MBB6670763.1 RICIN domain-containing protein [Cohnella nanjingensis]